MRVLELYKGTGSVGKVCEGLGWDVISHDIEKKYNPTICGDIMTWDYKKDFKPGDFDIITASPVCLYWSRLRNTWIGRKCKKIHPTEIITKEHILNDINNLGKPMVDKTFEIIAYFKPKYWWLENPKSSLMWKYIEEKYLHLNYEKYLFSYCKYSNWGYEKPTYFITNYKGVKAKICNKDCDNIITIPTQPGAKHKGYGTPIKSATRTLHKTPIGDHKKASMQKIHKDRMGTSKTIQTEDGKIIRVNTKELREKYKDYPNIQVKKEGIHAKTLGSWGKKGTLQKGVGGGNNREDRYRIPPLLIEELLVPILNKEYELNLE